MPNKERGYRPRMTGRQWELYRRSVVEEWQESPHKAAVIAAINHKLMILDLEEIAPTEASEPTHYADNIEQRDTVMRR